MGYSRHKLVEERTVDIPAGWELLTTDDETMSGLANAATDGNQALEDYFGGSENLEGLFRQGMLIMAMDLDNSTFEMTPNVSVFREKLEFNMSNDNFINLATKSYEEFGQTNLEEARLEINGKTTGRTLYADSSQGFDSKGIQLFWAEDGYGWYVTVVFAENESYYSDVARTVTDSVR